MRRRGLLYFALGGTSNPEYAACLRLALRTAALASAASDPASELASEAASDPASGASWNLDLEFAVICSPTDWRATGLREGFDPTLNGLRVSFFPLPKLRLAPSSDAERSDAAMPGFSDAWRVPYMAKLYAFYAIPDLARFDVVMYADADQLFALSVRALLREALGVLDTDARGARGTRASPAEPPEPLLLVAPEPAATWSSPYHFLAGSPLSSEQVRALRAAGAHPFNTGVLVFAPTARMRAHFDAILAQAAAHTGPAFFDQPFINTHFFARGRTRALLERPRYVLFPQAKTDYGRSIVHFCGTGTPKPLKLAAMQAYTRAYISAWIV
jgi:hypothetical protein